MGKRVNSQPLFELIGLKDACCGLKTWALSVIEQSPRSQFSETWKLSKPAFFEPPKYD